MPAPSLFAVSGDAIIDTSTGKPISPAEFNARATDADKAKIERDLASRSLMTNQEGEMGSAHVDDETPAREPEKPAGPAQKGGIPTLESFLEEAKPLNPDYSEVELAAAYRQTYPEASTIYKAPPIEDWVAQAKAINPDYSDEELKSAYTDVYVAPSVDDNSSDVLRGAKIVAKQAPQLAYGVTAGAGAVGEHLFGKGGISSAIKQYGVEGYQRYSADIAQDAKKSDSFNYSYAKAKEGDPRALVDWLQYAVGYVGAQGLELVATNVVGSIAGGLLLKGGTEMLASQMIAKQVPIVEATARQTGERLVAEEVAKRATALAAKQLGGNLAIGSAAFGMEGGEIFGDLVSKAKTEGRDLTGSELMKATVMTGLAGVTEFIGDKVGLDLLAGKSPIAQWITAKTGLTGRLARGTATGVVTGAGEGVTEYAQTILEEWGKGNDQIGRVSPETHAQAVDAAAIGAVGGHLAGQASGFATPPAPDKEPPGGLDPLDAVAPIVNADDIDAAIVQANRVADAPPISAAQLDLAVERQQPVRTFDADRYTESHRAVDQQALEHMIDRLDDASTGVRRDASGAMSYHGTPVQVVSPVELPAVTAPDRGLSKEKWDVLNLMAQAFGKSLIVFQSGPNLPDGAVLQQSLPNSIFLSTNTTGADTFSVFTHEALHHMEGTAFHDAFRKTIWEQLTPEAKRMAKARHGKLPSDELLLNEIASDVAGTELHKPEVWDKVFAYLREQVGDEQAKTEVLGFIDHLKAIIARVKILIEERPWVGVFGESRKTMAEHYVTDLTKVHNALAAAVGNALHETRAQAKTSALGNIPTQTKSSAVEKGKLALSKRSTSDRTIVPPDVAQTFAAIADAQRGAPEDAMLEVRTLLGGGVMSQAVEHAGDLIHRMTERAIYGIAGRELVREKVDKLITSVTHAYGFEKEHAENLANNARYYGKSASELTGKVTEALKTYANEHRKLPVYNLPQWLARAAAVSVGDLRIQDAAGYLKELKTIVDGEDFNARAFQVTRDANGKLEPYLRPIPARLIGIQKTGSVKIPDFALYNIEHDIPGHPSDSTLSDITLREEGFLPVATDLISKQEATAFRKQAEKNKLEASRKPTLTEKEKLDAARKNLVVEPVEKLTNSTMGHPLFSPKTDMTEQDRLVAKAYDAAPILDTNAVPAWDALKKETERLYQDVLTKVNVERVAGQPYADAASMNADIAKGSFKVTTDHSEHPLWDVDENFKFRVVHDYIGHFELDLDFSLDGERRAYEHHAAQLQDPLAKNALKVEVYGQAAAAIAHDGEFQPQKIFTPSFSASQQVTDVRFSPQGTRIGTETLPEKAKAPAVQWHADPLRATPEQIAQDWKGTGWGAGLPAVYQAYVPRADVPKARIPEMTGVYDWSPYKKSGVYPPITIVIHANGIAQKLDDGHHRVDYWRAKGFSHFPAWVVDFRPAVKKAMAPKEETVLFSPGAWFSALGNMLAEKMPAKASVEQVRNLLNSPGVKQDEVKWTGINDYLDQQTGPVDKHNLLAWLGQHNVEIEEVMKREGKREKTRSQLPDLSLAEFNSGWTADNTRPGFPGESGWIHRDFPTVRIRNTDDTDYYHVQIGEEFLSEYDNMLDHDLASSHLFDSFSAATEAAYEYLVAEPIRREAEHYDNEIPQTRYEGYKEPGGEDYTELLLTWKNPVSGARKNDKFEQAAQKRYGKSFDALNEAQQLDLEADLGEDSFAGANPHIFKSQHFDEPNILAHVRFDTRTDADGKTVLFLEEIQSDWHEQGREKGYKGTADTTGWTAKEGAGDPASGPVWEVRDANGRWVVGIPQERGTTAEQAIARAADSERGPDAKRVADAPFSKTWPELVMKRMLRYSAEHGVDRLAWTTGKMQNARYGLSKYVDSLEVAMDDVKTYSVIGRMDGSVKVREKGLSESKLIETIGKDLAQRAIEKVKTSDFLSTTLTGLDLEMGGSGMKYFYDQMLPKFMEKYLKKFGTKVVATQIATAGAATQWRADGTSNAVPKTESVHAIDITPTMKDSVMQGQPLFSPAQRPPSFAPQANPTAKPAAQKPVAPNTPQDAVDYDVIPAGTMIQLESIRASTGDTLMLKEDARVALRELDASLVRYRQLKVCLSS